MQGVVRFYCDLLKIAIKYDLNFEFQGHLKVNYCFLNVWPNFNTVICILQV